MKTIIFFILLSTIIVAQEDSIEKYSERVKDFHTALNNGEYELALKR